MMDVTECVDEDDKRHLAKRKETYTSSSNPLDFLIEVKIIRFRVLRQL